MRRRLLSVLTCVALSGTALLAHQGKTHQNVLGTVERVRGCHFVIKTQSGETKTIFVVPETTFSRGGSAVSLKDVTTGARVAVVVDEDGETAESVKVGGQK